MELNYKVSAQQGHFSLPTKWTPQEAAARQRVAVVAVFGRSTLDTGGCKASSLEAVVGQRIFNRDLTHPIPIDQKTLTGVDGYYDVGRRTVYLHLTAAYDTSTLIASLEHVHQLLQEKGFLMAWSSLKLGFAKSLLVLFSVSHILLLCHPAHTFDITYIHLFRTLDAIRSKAHNHLSELLRSVPGISKDWVAFGRLCAPRVLFLFSARLLPPQIRGGEEEGAMHRVRGGPGGRGSAPSSPLRNLELALEDQIYRLLRKSRVITNISANSLFALPNNQAYVYIMEETQPGSTAPPLIAATLHTLCGTPSASSTPSSAGDSLAADLTHLSLGALGRSDSGSGRLDPTTTTNTTTADNLSSSILSGVATERKRNLEHSFAVFLQQHIDQALGKGFDDNVGRHSGPVFFVVPRASVWFEAVNKIYNFFVTEPAEKDTKAKQVLGSLQNLVETEVRFSAARCAKVLPLALSTYKDGLPPHYTQLHHQEKLDMALTVLSGQARGPMYEEYVRQLEEACERVWRDGRMGCEVLSLSGNTCHHPRHNPADSEGEGGGERGLPVMPHSSGVTYISFCNCGRRQGQRDDPFSAHDANHVFYAHLAETCCSRLEAITFPTFKPSVSNARAAKVSGSEDDESDTLNTTTPTTPSTSDLPRSDIDGPPQQLLPRDPTDSGTPHTPGLSLGGVGGLSGSVCGGATGGRMTAGDHSHGGGSQVVITLMKEDVRMIGKDRGIIRQPSTTEYLPGMLTTASPPGLLPQWSSWALTCLGPSSLYSHNAGICDQPGFLPGTNFLLPWDVTVKIEDRDKWPAIADTLGKKALLLKNKKNRCGDLHEFSVKIFLGVEYECKSGHRFMLASPDRHLKASPSGLVKDNATKIANADMPLYFPCPCSRSGGGIMNGQLMRLHIVTPKAPVNVTLAPQVQPAPDPCPRFIPQPPTSLPVKLSASAYWVLRLPHTYVGDQGPHYPPDPRQPTPPSYARLHKGCYGISQVTLDR